VSFGVPAIQCIADFSFVPEWLLVLNPVLQTRRAWWYTDTILRRSYLGMCDLISRSDPNSFNFDTIVANSEWSRGLVRQKFGLESCLLYPAVVVDFPDVPFGERDDGFVCIGRVVPEKRMDAIIRILSKVRERGHNVHLHILGKIANAPYAQELKKLADENPEWVYLEGLTFGKKKSDLLAHHRYGINASINEPFGIAVAEMVTAGCISFVPNGGGQTEIVNHPNLIYESDEDAVNKIDAVLRDRQMQDGLADHLRVRAQKFSTQAFTEGILAITREFIETRKHAGICAVGTTPLLS
jgi:glycosyltransferase involved in cell wall biosynthesis